MRKILPTILTIFCFSAIVGAQNLPDLTVVEISEPEYVDSINGTRFSVLIVNNGKGNAQNVVIEVMDLDLTPEQAKEDWNADKDVMWIFRENLSMAEEGESDYDMGWNQTYTIAQMTPGEKIILIVELRDNWIYDPNCEIGVLIDTINTIQESNEANNQLGFFAGG